MEVEECGLSKHSQIEEVFISHVRQLAEFYDAISYETSPRSSVLERQVAD